MTGVVITTELGETRVLRSIEIGYRKNSTKPELSLKPGESVYTLHSKGAAYDVFWYHGEVLSDQIQVPEDGFGTPPFEGIVKVITRPKTEWWALLELSDGRLGWTKKTDSFLNQDACALSQTLNTVPTEALPSGR